MICFHSLNNWYLEQLIYLVTKSQPGCDLLSFFEQLIFGTTYCVSFRRQPVWWFAFILWTTDIWNNSYLKHKLVPAVVICFHSLNNWYLEQLNVICTDSRDSCDLLSFFEQLIFGTTAGRGVMSNKQLWFAFILWTTDIWNNLEGESRQNYTVVICFHSLNNWYLEQLKDLDL